MSDSNVPRGNKTQQKQARKLVRPVVLQRRSLGIVREGHHGAMQLAVEPSKPTLVTE